ncbi:MAG: nuclear transport factor 2 family protein [Microthrixaceae bacterium]
MADWDETELAAFYARHRALHEAGDWTGLGDLFTEDASYLDSVYGWSHGLPAIRAFLEESMRGLDEWTFPIHAVAYDTDTGTILNHWHNRLPGTRPDGTFYEVPGASVLTYAGDGRISRQMDLFDTKWMMRVVKEWIADHDGALPYPAPEG